MFETLDPPDRAKLISAYHALRYIEGDMLLGLGTGSTAAWLVKLIGAERRRSGLEIQAVSTSEATETLARSLGIPTMTLEKAEWLDLTIDGADEVDTDMMLIKGGGGALLREKIVATASDRVVIIADPSKLVDTLGKFPLPVEVVRFGFGVTRARVADVLTDMGFDGARIVPRQRDGALMVTDEGHHILDLHLQEIEDPDALAVNLLKIAGVVETGLFLDIADTVVIGLSSGEAEVLHTENDEVEAVDLPDDEELRELLGLVASMEKEIA